MKSLLIHNLSSDHHIWIIISWPGQMLISIFTARIADPWHKDDDFNNNSMINIVGL